MDDSVAMAPLEERASAWRIGIGMGFIAMAAHPVVKRDDVAPFLVTEKAWDDAITVMVQAALVIRADCVCYDEREQGKVQREEEEQRGAAYRRP